MPPNKEPVWLTTKEIIDKYYQFCYDKDITEKFLVKLYDAHLLRGNTNRRLKKIEILEESFLALIIHINYNLEQYSYKFGDNKISVPAYCMIEQKPKVYTNIENSWYTASEIIHLMALNYQCKCFTVEFLNELVEKFIVRGKYEKTMKVNLILLPSFKELMKYRNHTLEQNRIQE